MTVAAQTAMLLDRCLREQRLCHPNGDLSGLARRVQKQVAKMNAPVWLLATGADFIYPTTEGGRRTLFSRIMHPYLQQVSRVSTVDPEVGRALFDVTNLSSPPTALFHPKVLMRVIRGRSIPILEKPPTATMIGAQPSDQALL